MAIEIRTTIENSGDGSTDDGWNQVFNDRDTAAAEARDEYNNRFSEAERDSGTWDAFRHTYVSGRLIQYGYSDDFVHFLGTAREVPQMVTSPEDANMDRYNNELGRGIASITDSREVLARTVEDMIRGGDTITDKNNDPRKYEGEEPQLSADDMDALADAPPELALDPEEPLPPVSPIDLPQWIDDLLDDWGVAKAEGSPLVLDLDGNGIDLASVLGTDAVYWDIDQDGFAEKSGWISGGDGLLAIDLNSDGVINNHGELFGTDTTDGFTILSAYDTNTDGSIDVNDSQFSDLLVWVDANADGYSQSNELFSLTDLGITSINLNANLVDYYISDNHITHESTFTINGQTQAIVDAWFAYDNVNSHYQEDYTIDARTLFLPTLRGFGDVKDLHVAMSMDETLLLMVQEVATADVATLFDPAFDLSSKFEDILFRWAGVEAVDPDGRGIYVDGQELAFLESFFGETYL
ncbi:MAG: DUF6973 domain-containing protein, partial [Alphaproteobacteria bacterium]